MGAHQEPFGRPLPLYDFFGDPPVHVKQRIFAPARQKQALTCHPTKPCHSLSVLEVREILLKIPKNDKKCTAFGKEKKNSSKNSYFFVFLWVEVACGEHA
jgi:hypothetical protein